MRYKSNIFNLEISAVDLDFRDWLSGTKEGVWVRFIRKNCYVYLKGCPANTSSCVLIGSSELVIIRSLYMTSSRQVHLVLFWICMLESCDKLWSHLGHFHQVTQHFCLGTCKRHPYLLKSSLLNRSKHVQGVRITVSNLRWSRSRHRHWERSKGFVVLRGKNKFLWSFYADVIPSWRQSGLIYYCRLRNESGCSVWAYFLTICPKSVRTIRPVFHYYLLFMWRSYWCNRVAHLRLLLKLSDLFEIVLSLQNNESIKPFRVRKDLSVLLSALCFELAERYLFCENLVSVLPGEPHSCYGVQRPINCKRDSTLVFRRSGWLRPVR